MAKVIPITEFLSRGVDVGVKTINNPYSVVVYRIDNHGDGNTEVEVKHVVRGRKMFIKITADYSVVFEITANKDIDLAHDTYDGVNLWHKLIGLLVVHMYPFISNVLYKELVTFTDGISKGLRYDDEFGGLLVWRYEIRLKQPNPERITQFRDLILQYLHERLGVSEVVVHG